MTPPFVLVVWEDAEDPRSGGWLDAQDIEAFANSECLTRSGGYLVSKTAKYTTLAADWIEGLGHYGRVTKIPAGMIRSTDILIEGVD
jgi:hypothetical protein